MEAKSINTDYGDYIETGQMKREIDFRHNDNLA